MYDRLPIYKSMKRIATRELDSVKTGMLARHKTNDSNYVFPINIDECDGDTKSVSPRFYSTVFFHNSHQLSTDH